jgi:hypothetical protein
MTPARRIWQTVTRMVRRGGRCTQIEVRLDADEQARLEALYARTHPEAHRGISGCCDPPEDQPDTIPPAAR